MLRNGANASGLVLDTDVSVIPMLGGRSGDVIGQSEEMGVDGEVLLTLCG